MTTSMVLYGRDSGKESVPTVRVLNVTPDACKYLVTSPGEAPKEFATAASLMVELTGTRRHWSLGEYFKIGRWAPPEDPFDDVFRLFKPQRKPLTRNPVPSGLDPSKLALASGAGIDLVNRSDEVAKLLFAGFGSWIKTSGYDPDDVLQEVYRGLLARNRGKCAWVASKSSFGHYVHMVCHGVLANYHRQQKRKRQMEQTGVLTWRKGEGLAIADVASAELPASPTSEAEQSALLTVTSSLADTLGTGDVADRARAVLPLLRDGWAKKDIAAQLSLDRSAVDSAVAYLRERAAVWSSL